MGEGDRRPTGRPSARLATTALRSVVYQTAYW